MKIFIIGMVTILLATSIKAQENVTITMANIFGEPIPGEMPTHTPRIQQLIASLVGEYTDGQVTWNILQGKQADGIPIFRSPAMVAANDQIQATNLPASFFVKVPEMDIQAIPFLFKGVEHSRRFMNSEPAEWIKGKIENSYDVKVLGFFYNAAFVSVNSITPVLEPEDFNGKIVNGYGNTWDPMWSNIKPKDRHFIGFSEAMEGKLVEPNSDIDINIGMIQNNHGQRLYERFMHTTLVPNFYNIFYTMIINRDVWDTMSDFQRAGVERAVSEGQKASIAYQIDTTLWALQRNQSEGTKIHIINDAERTNWKNEFYPKMVKAVVKKSKNPEETREMILKIEALADNF